MSDEQKQRIGVSLAGIVAAALAGWGVIAWASEMETRISVLESQYSTVIGNQEYIIERIDRLRRE